MYQHKSILLSILGVFAVFNAFSQNSSLSLVSLNKSWSFQKANSKNISIVNIPHTWNAFDTMDDEPGYYRGVGIYKKKLVLKPEWKSKKLFLYFEGANQQTEVFLNGQKIGSHIGGYTAFRVPLNNLKFNGTDEVTVKVDNSFNESIAPLTADFTFYGGMYRSVSLEIKELIHFEDFNYASKAVFVHGNNVSQTNAEVVAEGYVYNASKNERRITILTTVKDASGKRINEARQSMLLLSLQNIQFKQATIKLSNPKLWSPEKPYLYIATTTLTDAATGKKIDEVNVPIGLRYFSFDVDKGFFLNGNPYKLIGASRHQDFARMGNAVPKSLQVKDIETLKDMGGNFLRVAHYPQDQSVLDACDRLGILAAVEIPIVNEITETEEFYNNCKTMQLEMIQQNFNHPSIIIWAYMNEVLLKMKFGNEPERKLKYLSNIEKLAQSLEDLTRKADPTRYTMMSNHGDVNGYIKAGLVKIPMLVGWNLYQGWYGGKIEDFGINLDRIHLQVPDKPLLVTEFGADVDPRIHAFPPVKFDKSLEYGMLYHTGYIKDILKRPFVVGAAVWNLADFGSETREETMPHVNNKGLLTLDRKPKNTFYLYKAYLNPKPFIKIGNGDWNLRGGIAAIQNLQVMSNADSVELFVNGKSLGFKRVIDHLANWEVSFRNGKNEIKAIAIVEGSKLEDLAIINFNLQPESFKNDNLSFKDINVLLGSQRQFIDDQNEVWLPSPIYKPGSWGSEGGEPFKIKNSSRLSYGSDKNIRGTVNDPVYQTQLFGIVHYQLDVPKGKYEITLHFAELMGNGIQSNLPYNLDSLIAVSKEVPEQRIFDVYLNDKLIIKNLNLASTYGIANSVKITFHCIVVDDKGIKLVFKSIKGKPVLNALQLKRIN